MYYLSQLMVGYILVYMVSFWLLIAKFIILLGYIKYGKTTRYLVYGIIYYYFFFFNGYLFLYIDKIICPIYMN